ncbi:MAG: TRAP transporter substrate-binding protein, partial [Methyloligellaceae bacterium]
MTNRKNNITRRSALSLLGAAVAAPAVLRYANAAEVTVRLHHMLPPISNMHKNFLAPWAKELSEKSGGRLNVQIFPSMQLGGKPSQLADQARKGVVDITWTLPGYTPGRFPIAETTSLPFMVTTGAKTSVVIHKLMDEFGQKEYDGIKTLAFHAHEPGKFHMQKKPITKASDLKGVSMRAPTQAFGQLLKALGADPIFLPVTEMAVSLTNGVIEGTCLPYEVVPAFKLHELTKFHSTTAPGGRGLYTQTFSLLMNQKSYEKLPDDLRKVIDDNTGIALSERIGKVFESGENFGLSLVNKAGNKINEIPKSEIAIMQEAAKP